MARLSLLVILLAAVLGCRHSRSEVDLLESELRWMEDQLYLLDDQLDQKAAQLQSCQRSNLSLKNLLMQQEPLAPRDRSPQGGILDRSRSGPSAGSVPARPPAADGGISPRPGSNGGGDTGVRPEIDRPLPETDENLAPPQIDLGEGAEDDPLGTPDASDRSEFVPRSSFPVAEPQWGVRLSFNRRLSGGYDTDGHPGDDGLAVLLQTQDTWQHPQRIVGPLELELHDADGLLVARWDFDAAAVEAHYRKTLFGEGVHLELPWPDRPPRTTRLELTARMLSVSDGLLIAKRPVEIDLPVGEPSDGHSTAPAAWTEPDGWTADRPVPPPMLHDVPAEPSLLPSPETSGS